MKHSTLRGKLRFGEPVVVLSARATRRLTILLPVLALAAALAAGTWETMRRDRLAAELQRARVELVRRGGESE